MASIEQLRAPLRLEDVDAADYDAVFYPGGHGPMEDLAVDPTSGALLTAVLQSGKPLGVVCHAPAALLATEKAGEASPFAGYKVAGFSNAEETQGGLADKAKWLLQDRLVALGVDYQEGDPGLRRWSSIAISTRAEPRVVRSAWPRRWSRASVKILDRLTRRRRPSGC